MTLVPVFNTNRMVEEYTERCYVPSHRRNAKLAAEHLRAARDLAQWRRRVASPCRGRSAGASPPGILSSMTAARQ